VRLVEQAVGEGSSSRSELVFLSPIVPAATGNGLAIRAGLQLEALSASFAVHVAVLPVAGGAADTSWAGRLAASLRVIDLKLGRSEQAAGAVELAGREAWRRRLGAASPLPHPAVVASPVLARRVVAALDVPARTPIHAVRSYLAPLAVAVGESLEASWLTLDVDDDDQALLQRQGDEAEAGAYERLLRVFGPLFEWLALSSPSEAAAVGRRLGLPTVVIPNAVDVVPARTRRSARRGATLLFVGNLTYPPNVEAAVLLARDILPRVRRLGDGDVRVELVGAFEPGGPVAELKGLAGVELLGHVDDLGAAYGRADVVVAPLVHAAGTRIKVLEALAWGIPVVTTGPGAAGLDVTSGRDLLVADDVDGIARATALLVGDRDLAATLAASGRRLVADTYSRAAVGSALRALMPRR